MVAKRPFQGLGKVSYQRCAQDNSGVNSFGGRRIFLPEINYEFISIKANPKVVGVARFRQLFNRACFSAAFDRESFA